MSNRAGRVSLFIGTAATRKIDVLFFNRAVATGGRLGRNEFILGCKFTNAILQSPEARPCAERIGTISLLFLRIGNSAITAGATFQGSWAANTLRTI